MKWRRCIFAGRHTPFGNFSRPSIDKIRQEDGIAWQEDPRLASHKQKGGAHRYFSVLSRGSPSWKLSGKLRHIYFPPVLDVGLVSPSHLPTSRSPLTAFPPIFSHCLPSSFFLSTRVALVLARGRDVSLLSNLAPYRRPEFLHPSRLLDSIPSLCRSYSSFSSSSPLSTSYPGPDPAGVIHCGCLSPPSHRTSVASHSKSSSDTQALLSNPCPASSFFPPTPTITSFSFFTRELRTNAASALGEQQNGQTLIPSDSTSSHAAGEGASVCTRDMPMEVERSSQSLTPRRSGTKRRLLNVVNRVQKGDVLNGLKVR